MARSHAVWRIVSSAAACGAEVMIVSDSAGLSNSQRLKGVHLAIKSGILAAERR